MLSFPALSTAITSWSSLSLDSRRTVSFPSCARLFTEPSSKRDPDGWVWKLDSVWMSEVRPRVRVVLFRVTSRSKRRLKQKETAYCSVVGSTFYLALKKNLKGVVVITYDISWHEKKYFARDIHITRLKKLFSSS